MTTQEGLALAVKALREALGDSFSPERVDAMTVDDEGKMSDLAASDIKKLL